MKESSAALELKNKGNEAFKGELSTIHHQTFTCASAYVHVYLPGSRGWWQREGASGKQQRHADLQRFGITC
jgi:hypothetical protein